MEGPEYAPDYTNLIKTKKKTLEMKKHPCFLPLEIIGMMIPFVKLLIYYVNIMIFPTKFTQKKWIVG